MGSVQKFTPLKESSFKPAVHSNIPEATPFFTASFLVKSPIKASIGVNAPASFNISDKTVKMAIMPPTTKIEITEEYVAS